MNRPVSGCNCLSCANGCCGKSIRPKRRCARTWVKPGEISSLPTHPADDDVEGLDSEIAIAQNEEFLLEQVNAAIERIGQERTVFASCGCTIDAARLQAIPYTSRCIDCARGQQDEIEKPVRGETATLPLSLVDC